jgi:hypothetical protein
LRGRPIQAEFARRPGVERAEAGGFLGPMPVHPVEHVGEFDGADTLPRDRACPTDFRRRSPIGFGEQGIEPAKAAEPGPHRDLRHRKCRHVEQPFRMLYTARLRNLDGARTQMLPEEAAEMACTDAEPIGKVFNGAFIKCAICNEAKRTLYCCA